MQFISIHFKMHYVRIIDRPYSTVNCISNSHNGIHILEYRTMTIFHYCCCKNKNGRSCCIHNMHIPGAHYYCARDAHPTVYMLMYRNTFAEIIPHTFYTEHYLNILQSVSLHTPNLGFTKRYAPDHEWTSWTVNSFHCSLCPQNVKWSLLLPIASIIMKNWQPLFEGWLCWAKTVHQVQSILALL